MSSKCSSKLLPLFLCFFFFFSSSSALNITELLSQFPEYSTYYNVLQQTNIIDDINRRQTITLLVARNDAFSVLAGQPDDVVKNVFSLHVILDYFDAEKLKKLEKKTALLTTLFQSSGQAKDRQGFLNVTVSSDGTIVFGSAVSGAEHNAKFVQSVVTSPYDISIIEVSSIISAPGMLRDLNAQSSSSSVPSPDGSPANSQSSNKSESAANPPDKSATPAASSTDKESTPAASPTDKQSAPAASPTDKASTPAASPTDKQSAPAASPTDKQSAPPASPAGKESPADSPNDQADGKSPSKAPTSSTAGSPNASSPTVSEEPLASESPTDIAPSEGTSTTESSPPEPTAGGTLGPAAEGPDGTSSAAPIDGLKMGAFAVIFASTWALF